MSQEKRTLFAVILSVAVLIGWSLFFGQKEITSSPAVPSVEGAKVEKRSEEKVGVLPPSARPATNRFVVKKTTKETSRLAMEWTSDGGTLSKIAMKNYSLVNLLPFEGEKGVSLTCEDCNLPIPADGDYPQVSESDRGIAYEAVGERLVVRKEYDWNDDRYLINLRLTVENRSRETFQGRLGLGWRARQFPEAPKGIFNFLKGPADQRSFFYNVNHNVVHEGKEPSQEVRGAVAWAGIEDRYFLISIISRRVSSDQLLRFQRENDRLDFSLSPAVVTIPPQGKYEEVTSFYMGPKERGALQVAGVELEKAVDYGWFAVVAVPILKLLQIFHSAVGNWGLAIIILTLFVKLLMNPLTIKSMKQMKEMQKLQPKLAALKEKYKDDKQRLNTETMQLFKTHQVNPMGGCFPMLLQMPIYIALYKVLYNAIELYHAPFFWFYRDLSAPDPYFILPVLLGVSMVAQQKMTPSTSADPAQKQMMMIMPVLFTAFMLFLPLGLVLYIFVNTASSVLQQWMYQNDIGWKDLLRGNFLKGTRGSP